MSFPSNTFSRHYRTFRTQNDKNNTKIHKFIIKFIGIEFDDKYEDFFEKILSPVEVVFVSKPKVSTLGENPVDFPLIAYGTMTTFEIHTRGSITPEEIKQLIFETTKWSYKHYWITYLHDPTNKNMVDYQRIINQIEGKDVDYYPQVLGYEPNINSEEDKDPQELVGSNRIKDMFNKMKEEKK